VLVVADALEAFLVEERWRARGLEVVVVWSRDGVAWFEVSAGDSARPAPAPPPQARRWFWWGRNRLAFRRRRAR
jgi:hypothetical protein